MDITSSLGRFMNETYPSTDGTDLFAPYFEYNKPCASCLSDVPPIKESDPDASIRYVVDKGDALLLASPNDHVCEEIAEGNVRCNCLCDSWNKLDLRGQG